MEVIAWSKSKAMMKLYSLPCLLEEDTQIYFSHGYNSQLVKYEEKEECTIYIYRNDQSET